MGNTSDKALFLSKTRVEWPINKGKTVLALFVLENGEGEIPLHPLAQPLIHEFKDVFPSALPPGLPLVRGIEHPVGLLPEPSLLITQHIGVFLLRPRSCKFRSLLIEVTSGRA